MRHRMRKTKLNRNTAQRKSLSRNLALALIEHERIQTTETKAKYVRGQVERLITIAKRGLAHDDPQRAVHARRVVGSRLYNNREAVSKLFDDLAPRFEAREGGYTRILKLEPRKGDNAPMVLLEFVEREEV